MLGISFELIFRNDRPGNKRQAGFDFAGSFCVNKGKVRVDVSVYGVDVERVVDKLAVDDFRRAAEVGDKRRGSIDFSIVVIFKHGRAEIKRNVFKRAVNQRQITFVDDKRVIDFFAGIVFRSERELAGKRRARKGH